jgi:periplasmic protein TonB
MKKLVNLSRIIFVILFSACTVSLIAQDKQQKTKPSAKNTEAYETVDKMPVFPGGMDALLKFIGSNVKYPVTAMKDKISGTVNVKFVVDKDGSVIHVKAMNKIGGGCEQEAIRVVKLLPKWTPGENKGEKVPVYFTLPVKFVLS